MVRAVVTIAVLASVTCQQRTVDRLGTGLNDLERMLANPALTTTASDAVFQLPDRDGWDVPEDWYVDLTDAPQTASHRYSVLPGWYRIDLETYCLKPGAWGPSTHRGEGWVYAPLKGPRADVIGKILDRSVAFPDVHQHAKQKLIWAIIARARLSDMSADTQALAARMLDPEDLVELEGGIARIVSRPILDRAMQKLPAPARMMREAEYRLRQASSTASTTYEDLAEIAVRTGEMPDDAWLDHLPKGRWSRHPDGHMVRYEVYNYASATQFWFVPDFTWKHDVDAFGRVVRSTNHRGFEVRIAYDEDLGAITSSDHPSVAAWWVDSVTLTVGDDAITFEDPGPTLVRLPTDTGERSGPRRIPGATKAGSAPGALRRVQSEEDWENSDMRVMMEGTPEQRREVINRLVMDRTGGDATSVDHYKDLLDKVKEGRSREAVIEHQKSLIKTFIEFRESLKRGGGDREAQDKLDDVWKEQMGWQEEHEGKSEHGTDGTATSGNEGYSQINGQSTKPR